MARSLLIILLLLAGTYSNADTCTDDGMSGFATYCAAISMTCPAPPTTGWGPTTLVGVECRRHSCNVSPAEYYVTGVFSPSSCGSDHKSGGGDQGNQNSCSAKGSIIQTENSILGEVIPLQGSTFDLVYHTDRVEGYKARYTIYASVTGADIRPDVVDLKVEIYDESNTLVDDETYSNVEDQTHTFVFDGLNSSNVETWGSLKYKSVVIEDRGVTEIPVTTLVDVGSLKVKKLGLGGWAPSVWRFYDPSSKTLYRGDGTIRKVEAETLLSGNYRIAEEDGWLVHEFNTTGLILNTKLGITGTTIYSFTYSSGKLTQITEPHSLVTTFDYDMGGNLESITNPYSQVFTIGLDGNGYIDNLSTPASEVYEMTYDADGLLLTFEKPNGAINEFTYDANGLLLKDEHSGGYYADVGEETPGSYGKILSYTSRMGRKTTYEGDGVTYPRAITRPTGQIDSYSFSDTGTSFTSNGETKSSSGVADTRFGSTSWLTNLYYIYTPSYTVSLNRADTITLNSADPFDIDTWTTNITNGTIDTDIVYDGSTKEYLVTTDVGRTYRREIDTYRRPVEEQIGSLTAIAYTYTGKNLTGIAQGARSATLAYNGVGLLSSITNDLSQTTAYAYDSAGRLNTVTLHDARVIDYDYDSVGRLTSVTPDGRSAHVFNFNASELMDEYAPPLITGVPNVTTDYTYNNDNQLTQIGRPDGQDIDYAYDATTGLLTSTTTPQRVITYTYASNSNLPTVIDHDAGIDLYRTYSGPDVTQEDFYDNSSNYLGYFSTTFNSSYGDIDTEVIAGSSGSSRTITYKYDDDRLLKGTNSDLTLTYATPNGTLTSTDFGNVDDAYGYNSFGEVTAYDATYSSTNKYSLDFTRDDLGRITQKIESINGGSADTYDYTYDSTGRLTQVNKNSTTYATYSYDDNNNRTGGTINSVSTSGTYDTQDRMTDFNVNDYTYNANGELTSKTNTLTSQVWSYSYDAEGNLASVTLPSTHVISYKVDGLNRRIEKYDNSTRKYRYIYDTRGRIVGEINVGGTLSLKRRYVYVTKAHVPDYFYEGSTKYRIITDNLGSPRIIIKASDGTIMQTMKHDEFGRVISDSSPGYTPFGFAGGIYDPDTGLVRFGARDYDPETGRWTSKDPILFNGFDPNLYGYTWSDPVNRIDINGLWSITIGGYWGVGGSITFGRNPNGRIFTGIRAGVGAGSNLSFDPNGQSPSGNTCGGASSFGIFSEVGAQFGPLELGASSQGGYSSQNGFYGGGAQTQIGFTPSIGVGGGASTGFEIYFQ